MSTARPPRIDKRQSLEKMLVSLSRRGLYPCVQRSGAREWLADVDGSQSGEFGRTPSAALRKAIRAWEKEQ